MKLMLIRALCLVCIVAFANCAGVPRASAGVPVGIALDQALDTTNLTWVAGGPSNWFGQSLVTYDGVDAAQSGKITNGQISFIQTTVSGPGTLTFWWKIFTTNFDTLDFYIGGEYENSIYVDTDWDFQTWEIPAGPQTLRWEFVKDAGGSDSGDAAWLDQVTFTRPPLPPPAKFLSLTNTGFDVQFTVLTQSNWTHYVEYRSNLQTGSWVAVTNFIGNGGVTNFTQPLSGLSARFYRVNIY